MVIRQNFIQICRRSLERSAGDWQRWLRKRRSALGGNGNESDVFILGQDFAGKSAIVERIVKGTFTPYDPAKIDEYLNRERAWDRDSSSHDLVNGFFSVQRKGVRLVCPTNTNDGVTAMKSMFKSVVEDERRPFALVWTIESASDSVGDAKLLEQYLSESIAQLVDVLRKVKAWTGRSRFSVLVLATKRDMAVPVPLNLIQQAIQHSGVLTELRVKPTANVITGSLEDDSEGPLRLLGCSAKTGDGLREAIAWIGSQVQVQGRDLNSLAKQLGGTALATESPCDTPATTPSSSPRPSNAFLHLRNVHHNHHNHHQRLGVCHAYGVTGSGDTPQAGFGDVVCHG
eukprot:GFYU01000682.1.p1 GENE.GFYU01000682.1~~GFYU01000682.1.p1  ORF type:complete len:375 (+),score=41.98 GFYU01000682.1:98-1126(+)